MKSATIPLPVLPAGQPPTDPVAVHRLAGMDPETEPPVPPGAPAEASAPAAEDPGRYEPAMPLTALAESPLNKRKHFDQAKLEDLAASIRKKGVIEPLIVRPLQRGVAEGPEFEIIAGARRYRASKLAGVPTVQVVVRRLSDVEALEIILIENLQRADLAPLEEAEGYAELLQTPGYDVARIAEKIGRAPSYVLNRLKLLDLIEPARKALEAEDLPIGHAMLLATLQEDDQKDALRHSFREEHGNGKSIHSPVSLRYLQDYVSQNIICALKKAPFDVTDAGLVPAAGACTTCPKRTGAQPGLFADVAKSDSCADRTCFAAKQAAGLKRKIADMEADGTKVVRLSADYGRFGVKPAKGKEAPLTRDHWREAKAKCKTTAVGILVDGRDQGKTQKVCADPKCKACRTGYDYNPSPRPKRDPKAEEAARKAKEKREQEGKTREAQLEAIVAKIGAVLGVEDVRMLAASALQHCGWEGREVLKRLVGREIEAAGGKPPKEWYDLEHSLGKLDVARLNRVMVIAALAGETIVEEFRRNESGALKAAVARHGVKVAAPPAKPTADPAVAKREARTNRKLGKKLLREDRKAAAAAAK